MEENLIYDELWPDGPKLIRNKDVFALGTDSVLLSAFANFSGVKRALDLGCGAGIIAILAAWNNEGLTADGLEIQPHAAELATENVKLNNLAARVNITCGDIRRHREIYEAGAYDLVLSNPPYFTVSSGKPSENSLIAAARDERMCTLSQLCEAAAYLTKWGGRFALVHRPERLSEALCSLTNAGLEPKRLRLVQARAMSEPSLVLIEARRGGSPGLKIEAPFVLYNEHGADTDEIKRIYHRF